MQPARLPERDTREFELGGSDEVATAGWDPCIRYTLSTGCIIVSARMDGQVQVSRASTRIQEGYESMPSESAFILLARNLFANLDPAAPTGTGRAPDGDGAADT